MELCSALEVNGVTRLSARVGVPPGRPRCWGWPSWGDSSTEFQRSQQTDTKVPDRKERDAWRVMPRSGEFAGQFTSSSRPAICGPKYRL